MPPGRPRQWRKQLFDILLKDVRERLEGNQLEDKSLNRQWLARFSSINSNKLFIIIKDIWKFAVKNLLTIFD